MPPPDAPLPLIDARGHRCPVPTLRLRRAIEALKPGESVHLICDDPLARIDVPHYVTEAGLTLVSVCEDGELLNFVVAKPAS